MAEHSCVTVDREHPLPREIGPHPRSWALLVAAMVAALFGLLTIAMTV